MVSWVVWNNKTKSYRKLTLSNIVLAIRQNKDLKGLFKAGWTSTQELLNQEHPLSALFTTKTKDRGDATSALLRHFTALTARSSKSIGVPAKGFPHTDARPGVGSVFSA